MRRVGVALAACLVASTFATGQGNNASSGPKSNKSSSEAVAVRLSEMQKSIEAQQQQIQHLVEQVRSRDSQIQELQQRMNQVQSSASQAQQAAEAATSQNTQEEQSMAAIRSTSATDRPCSAIPAASPRSRRRSTTGSLLPASRSARPTRACGWKAPSASGSSLMTDREKRSTETESSGDRCFPT